MNTCSTLFTVSSCRQGKRESICDSTIDLNFLQHVFAHTQFIVGRQFTVRIQRVKHTQWQQLTRSCLHFCTSIAKQKRYQFNRLKRSIYCMNFAKYTTIDRVPTADDCFINRRLDNKWLNIFNLFSVIESQSLIDLKI